MSGLNQFFRKRRRAIEQGLADVRQWYYMHSVNERQKIRQDMEAMVKAAEPFSRRDLTVQMKYDMSAQDSEGSSVSASATLSPGQILKAMDDWDGADEQTANFVPLTYG